jgi:cytochrome c-type biogenesis protein CcmF
MTALFVVPMLAVLAVGPLLRWRRDRFGRVGKLLLVPGVLALAGLAVAAVLAPGKELPIVGLALAPAIAVASVLPLKGRELRRVKLPLWGMVLAHLGIAVALFGMAADSAFTTERLVALRVGETAQVGPWAIRLGRIEPVAGPNWTALEARLQASYKGAAPVLLDPQARTFWAPPQNTAESALHTRWNGQLYTVIGDEAPDDSGVGRWQLRLWWKPFVPMIWLGGVLIGLGGLLALLGRVASDVRRLVAKDKIAYRRERQGR